MVRVCVGCSHCNQILPILLQQIPLGGPCSEHLCGVAMVERLTESCIKNSTVNKKAIQLLKIIPAIVITGHLRDLEVCEFDPKGTF